MEETKQEAINLNKEKIILATDKGIVVYNPTCFKEGKSSAFVDFLKNCDIDCLYSPRIIKSTDSINRFICVLYTANVPLNAKHLFRDKNGQASRNILFVLDFADQEIKCKQLELPGFDEEQCLINDDILKISGLNTWTKLYERATINLATCIDKSKFQSFPRILNVVKVGNNGEKKMIFRNKWCKIKSLPRESDKCLEYFYEIYDDKECEWISAFTCQ
jgi:hypothetical protein